jgi:hypothetical protein
VFVFVPISEVVTLASSPLIEWSDIKVVCHSRGEGHWCVLWSRSGHFLHTCMTAVCALCVFGHVIDVAVCGPGDDVGLWLPCVQHIGALWPAPCAIMGVYMWGLR